MGEQLKFILNDKLPTYYDATISIFTECQKLRISKMSTTVSAYTDALVEMRLKSFGEERVPTRRAVKMKAEKLVGHYYDNVYIETCRTKPSKKGNVL